MAEFDDDVPGSSNAGLLGLLHRALTAPTQYGVVGSQGAADPIVRKVMPQPGVPFGGAPKGGGVMAAMHEPLPGQKLSDQQIIDMILAHANTERYPVYPMAENPIFKPADPALTKAMVPQVSIADKLPQLPAPGSKLPLGGRASQILDKTPELGAALAKMIRDNPEANLPFYSTGTVLQGMQDIGGLTPEESSDFMRHWAGQGAATSPRTETPPNLRNDAYLLWRRGMGDPLTPEKQLEEQASGMWGQSRVKNKQTGQMEMVNNLNRPGYPMMQMHTTLADEFVNNAADPLKNPKPFNFREAWAGNMADPVADTHNIRAILDAYDQMYPGQLHPKWFESKGAYDRYKANGGFDRSGPLPVGDIADALGTNEVKGQKIQTEYPIMQGPTREAARILNISPGEAQERLWFAAGPRTGLQSPPMTIPDLFNAQIEKTSKVTGETPETILKLFLKHRIPLAENQTPPPSGLMGAMQGGLA